MYVRTYIRTYVRTYSECRYSVSGKIPTEKKRPPADTRNNSSCASDPGMNAFDFFWMRLRRFWLFWMCSRRFWKYYWEWGLEVLGCRSHWKRRRRHNPVFCAHGFVVGSLSIFFSQHGHALTPIPFEFDQPSVSNSTWRSFSAQLQMLFRFQGELRLGISSSCILEVILNSELLRLPWIKSTLNKKVPLVI